MISRRTLPYQTLVRSGPAFCFATVNGRHAPGDRFYDFENHRVLLCAACLHSHGGTGFDSFQSPLFASRASLASFSSSVS